MGVRLRGGRRAYPVQCVVVCLPGKASAAERVKPDHVQRDFPRTIRDAFFESLLSFTRPCQMPVSRRSRRSAAAEEDIEEDAASHRPADDDVEMHDEKSTGARAGRVKGKGKAKAGAQAEDDSEASDAVEEDGALPFDAEEFRRQPVNAQEGQKLSGMASDWAQMGALLKGNAFTILKNAASTIANEADGEDSKVCAVSLLTQSY